jgi:IPT/TIG domain
VAAPLANGNVLVTSGQDPNGMTAASYTYEGPPTVTAVAPKSGPLGGAQAVTITGTNFTGASAVKFATSAATSVVVVSSTKITAKTPAHAAGIVDVQVVTPSGTSTLAAADKYTYEGAPTVTAVAPKSGPLGGAQAVTITGTNFTGASSVKFSTSAATTVVVVSSTKITAKTPAHAAGIVNVLVVMPSGSSALGPADKYTYEGAPTITAVAPKSGPPGGAQAVTITGTNFTGA